MEEDVEIALLLSKHGMDLDKAANEFESEYEECVEKSSNCEGEESDTYNWTKYKSLLDDGQNSVATITSIGTEDGDTSDEMSKLSIVSEMFNENSPKILCNRGTKRRQFLDSGDESDDLQDVLDKEIISLKAKSKRKFLQKPDRFSNEGIIQDNNDEKGNKEELEVIQELLAGNELNKESFDQFQSKAEDRTEDKTLLSLKYEILSRAECYQKIIDNLKRRLEECQEAQTLIRQDLIAISLTNQKRLPSVTRCFFKKFGMPYFEDSKGFTPLPNEDTRKKLTNGELIVSTVPRMKYWTKAHKEMLQDAIKSTIIEEHTETIMKRIFNLDELCKITKSVKKQKEIADKIIEQQRQLRRFKKMSYSELLAQEDPDREYDWLKYSATVFNGAHSSDECQRFWHVYLKPSVNKSCWEVQEDYKLLDVATKLNFQDWDSIAKLLGTNRTAYQCFVHYKTRIHERPDISSGKWSKEEDEKLISVINASQIGDFIPWTKVASHFSNRSHGQIYNRWINCLDPSLVKGKFSKEEDFLIVSGIEVFNVSYKEMASLLASRTASQIRERYERYLQPKTAKVGTWSLDEDEKLLSLVEKYGDQNWRAISQEMKTRTRTQVRQRYSFINYMSKNKPGWTPDKVKRRNIHKVNQNMKRTEKHVEKVKQEIENVKKTFKLSSLEMNCFKIEKLKELRDKLIVKKIDPNSQRTPISDRSDEYKALNNYFQCEFSTKSAPLATFWKSSKDFYIYLNQLLTLAKYYGHDITLPECETGILENRNLNFQLKSLITRVIQEKQTQLKCEAPEDQASSVSNSSNQFQNSTDLDYKAPDTDDTLIMMEWWHTPPVNVQNLNFSEFFKRTVFDYSYAMHKDIWISKLNRSQGIKPLHVSSVEKEEEEEPSLKPIFQPYLIPPNLETLIGMRSLRLSRKRIRQLSKKAEHVDLNLCDSGTVKCDLDPKYQLIDDFQETIISLFTWPKIFSLTSIESTSILPAYNSKSNGRRSRKKVASSHKNIVELLDNPEQESSDVMEVTCSSPNSVSTEKKTKKLASVKQLILDRKRTLADLRKGIKPQRKMKVEHLINSTKTGSGSLNVHNTNKKPTSQNRNLNKRGRSTKKVNTTEAACPTSKSVTKAEVSIEGVYDILPLQSPKIIGSKTYQRTKKLPKEKETCHVEAKKVPLSCSKVTHCEDNYSQKGETIS